jgi:hypothetical protein
MFCGCKSDDLSTGVRESDLNRKGSLIMLSMTVRRLGRFEPLLGEEGRAAAAAAGAEEKRMPICRVAVLSREIFAEKGAKGGSSDGTVRAVAATALLSAREDMSFFSGE